MAGGLPDMAELAAAVQSYEQAVSSGQIQRDPKLEEILETFRQAEGQTLLGEEGLKIPQTGTSPAAQSTSEEIVPEPAFVIKTSDLKDGTKVFINVCGSDKVAAPGDWGKGIPAEVEEAMAEMDGDAGAGGPSQVDQSIRFPLSLSDATPSIDNSGAACLIYDVILNSEVARQAKAVRRLKEFVINLCMAWVGHKHKRELDPKFKLPRSLYKGGPVNKHRIRAETKPLITEVAGPQGDDTPTFALPLAPPASKTTPSSTPSKVAPSSKPAKAVPKPEDSRSITSTTSQGLPKAADTGASEREKAASKEVPVHRVQYEGCPVTQTNVHVELPALRQADCLDVYLLDNKLVVEAAGTYAPLEVSLLFPPPTSRSTACWDAKLRELLVRLPYQTFGDHVKELMEAAPHALGELEFVSDKFLELD